MSAPLLELEDLTIQYKTGNGWLTAVSDASFTIEEGEYFGLVGESGCGKSTIARAIMGGLDDNGRVSSGKILYKGEEIQNLTGKELNRSIRWKEISLVPQSSMNSLDPLRRIDKQAIELAEVHSDMGRDETVAKLEELFETVGLQTSRVTDYPHQFSGGMQQRAIIAFALLLDPALIIADEPTTALDVIMQDQVFKYLDEIREQTNTGMMLITHDISVVFESCRKMAVMHAGQVAETGRTSDIDKSPRHPYSILLQNAFPDVRNPERELEVIEGVPPQLIGDVDFCTFADRCPWAIKECKQHAPAQEPIDASSNGHAVSCIRKDEVHELYESGEGQRVDSEENKQRGE